MTEAHFVPERGRRRPAARDLVVLTGADLTIADVEAVARHGARAALDIHARERMQEARDVIERAGRERRGRVRRDDGLRRPRDDVHPARRRGARSRRTSSPRTRRVSVAPFPREVVRAMLLLRANTLALGHSGCRPLLVDRDLRAPRRAGSTRSCRSRGASARPGDLAPLAHLALPLIGRGEVEVDGQRSRRADGAPRARAWSRSTLQPKEGLALLNGTQLMSRARGAARSPTPTGSSRTASVAAAMSVEALLGTEVAFAAPYQLARPHPGQVAVAAELRHLLRGSGLQPAHHDSAHKVQDPYSLRCVPQVHGAVRDALDHLRRVLDIELNSATDNPLVFPGGGSVPVDALATGGGLVISRRQLPRRADRARARLREARAVASSGSISERRTALLVDARLNGGLPAFLSPDPGRNSGLMIVQYTAAALASENKVLAHPSSADSIPTSANQEDHVSMGATAARHARTVLGHVEQILAIELLCAAQALDLRLALLASDGLGAAAARRRRRRGAPPGPRERSGPSGEDREPGPDLAATLALVHDGALVDLVGP